MYPRTVPRGSLPNPSWVSREHPTTQGSVGCATAGEGLWKELDGHQGQHGAGGEREGERKQARDLLEGDEREHGAHGLRRAGKNRAPELLGATEAGAVHGNGHAGSFGEVLQSDRQKDKQRQPCVSEAKAVPRAKPSGRL